eukprot:96639-Prymnesium_polylepis.1
MLPMSLRLSERREELVHTDDKVSANALVRLAVNPTPEVGSVQRRTTSWLLRVRIAVRSHALSIVATRNAIVTH